MNIWFKLKSDLRRNLWLKEKYLWFKVEFLWFKVEYLWFKVEPQQKEQQVDLTQTQTRMFRTRTPDVPLSVALTDSLLLCVLQELLQEPGLTHIQALLSKLQVHPHPQRTNPGPDKPSDPILLSAGGESNSAERRTWPGSGGGPAAHSDREAEAPQLLPAAQVSSTSLKADSGSVVL